MRMTFARAAITAATNLLQARRARRTHWALQELSDAQLKDIGLTRSDLARMTSRAGRPFTD
jgi:uncharacterized protein YjiS (DUF1127 family)